MRTLFRIETTRMTRSLPGQERRLTTARFGTVPDLPWTTRAEMEPGSDYLVMASHLPLKRISSTVRFFRGVSAVRKQLAAADGLVGYTLRAKPLARDYWTLSVWKDQTALREFMRTPPHVQLMSSLKPLMGPTKFVTWQITAADGHPTLAGALERLASG
jgi:quinol monooxygenase YgiN